MTRWEQVEQLYHRARVLPSGDRHTFLSGACGDDAALMDEVQSLLQQAGAVNGFLEQSILPSARPSLEPGDRLGAYAITGLLGRGGMGDVYQARDPRLDRDVAIKLLPDEFARDLMRLARFEHEAKLLAQLNHSGIAAIFGLEEAGERRFLVLELVPGVTLAELAPGRPLPLDHALDLAGQIAEAMETAHERGIVHRDLKPANIKVTPDGKVKVLDFGLARTTRGIAGHRHPTGSSAVITGASDSGVIVGTAAYMSPEQARGRPVDARTDVWAFGCVLFELLTGTRAFDGATVSDTLVTVLSAEPDWSRLPADTPPLVWSVIRRCLEKSPGERLRSLADARLLLRDSRLVENAGPPVPARQPLSGFAAAIAIAATALLGGWLLGWGARPSSRIEVDRFVVPVTTGHLRGNEAMAVSPDGRSLTFAVQEGSPPVSQLYIRSLDRLDATLLQGTRTGARPFFSHDGEWIGFFTNDALMKVSVAGGPPIRLSPAPVQWGGAWGADDTIVFGAADGLWRVGAGGGTAVRIASLAATPGARSFRWPQVLPNGSVLFTLWREPLQHDIAILLPDGTIRTLETNGTKPRFVAPDRLIFGRETTLMAAEFDPDRGALRGRPVPVLNGVRADQDGTMAFALSAGGTLIYNSGEFLTLFPKQLLMADRKGAESPLPFPSRPYLSARLSPDGQHLAVAVDEHVGQRIERSIWVGNLERATLTRLTFDVDTEADLTWTPDSTRVSYRRKGGGLYWRRIDLTTAEEEIAPTAGVASSESAGAWSPDGKTLMFNAASVTDPMGHDLWTLTKDDSGTFRLASFLRTAFDEYCPEFSPDGRWISYVANDSGRPEIYVRPFPGPGPVTQVSAGGGAVPHWRGPELVFLQNSPLQLKSASTNMGAAATLTVTPPRTLFSIRGGTDFLTSDAANQSFVLLEAGDALRAVPRRTEIIVVTNWAQELPREKHDR